MGSDGHARHAFLLPPQSSIEDAEELGSFLDFDELWSGQGKGNDDESEKVGVTVRGLKFGE